MKDQILHSTKNMIKYININMITLCNIFKKLADKYVSQNWNTLLPIAQYFESHEDDKHFESPYKNETKPGDN